MFVSTTSFGFATAVVLILFGVIKDCSSNPGTEFLLVFPQSKNNQFYNNGEVTLEIFVTLDVTSGQTDAEVTITMRDPNEEYTMVVTEETPGVFSAFPNNHTFPIGNIKGAKYLTYVVATNMVTVMVKNGQFTQSNTDSYLAIPSAQLGNAYLAIAYTSTVKGLSASFIVIATGNNPAYIKITLPGDSYVTGGIQIDHNDVSYVNNDVIFLNLDAFEACQMQFLGSDISGTLIESDNVIAVWSGNNRTNLVGMFSKSHVLEQVPPIEMAGSQFVACASCNRNSYSVYRILNIYQNTEVTIHSFGENTKLYTLSRARTVLELSFEIRQEVSFVETSKPSMFYYVSSSAINGTGDVFSMVIPPLDGTLPIGYSFQVEMQYTTHYSIIFVVEGTGEALTINDYPLQNSNLVFGLDLEYYSIEGKPGYVMGCLIGENAKTGTWTLRNGNGTPFLAVYEELRGYEGLGNPLGYGLAFQSRPDLTDKEDCCVSVNSNGVSLFSDECGISYNVSCCVLDYQVYNCRQVITTKTCSLLDKPKLSTDQREVVADSRSACQLICAGTTGCVGVNIDPAANVTASQPGCQLLFGTTYGFDRNATVSWRFLQCSTRVVYALESKII